MFIALWNCPKYQQEIPNNGGNNYLVPPEFTKPPDEPRFLKNSIPYKIVRMGKNIRAVWVERPPEIYLSFADKL